MYREGALQDFQTVAILGFAADTNLLNAMQIEVVKKGLRRQAGREHVVDGVPMAFCTDVVGILGIVLGTRAVGDVNITSQIVAWTCKFLGNSYGTDCTEDWQRCLLYIRA
jgi:hypothetical protein